MESAFSTLLARLATQHQAEIRHAVQKLQEENAQLSSQIDELRLSPASRVSVPSDFKLQEPRPTQLTNRPQASISHKRDSDRQTLWDPVVSASLSHDKNKFLNDILLVQNPPAGPLAFIFGDRAMSITGFLILLNSVWNGLQTEFMINALYEGRPQNDYFVCGDLFFAVVFTVELITVFAAGPTFFIRGPDRRWNIFDTFVVIFSWLECCTELLDIDNDFDLGFLRTLRLIRLVRILRSGNEVPGIHSTQVLLQALTGCVESFTSAVVLLLGVISVFALSFMQAALGNLKSHDANDELSENLYEYFGSIGKSFWTLLAVITGGVDWLEMTKPIRKSWLYTIFVFAYIMCVSIGLMSLLMGIFVHAATEAMKLNGEIAVHEKMQERQQIAGELFKIFLECDTDMSLTVSTDELIEKLHDERIMAYFMHLDLDPSSLFEIFKLVDTEGAGQLGLSEFVDGCVTYRGTAKAVHIGSLQKEVSKLQSSMKTMQKTLCGDRVRESPVDRVRASWLSPSTRDTDKVFDFSTFCTNGEFLSHPAAAAQEDVLEFES